eukprot:TRINITY_DN101674_c0_g1_i1.p1 TRINITY_DN101674_c0_g1~~TRINITY_DN101674_c0_g1_i1.p1  ORF type:complete len:604 (+),score=125.69 TRINITY_DN101674_c0_g1_i1:102-1913(+)
MSGYPGLCAGSEQSPQERLSGWDDYFNALKQFDELAQYIFGLKTHKDVSRTNLALLAGLDSMILGARTDFKKTRESHLTGEKPEWWYQIEENAYMHMLVSATRARRGLLEVMEGNKKLSMLLSLPLLDEASASAVKSTCRYFRAIFPAGKINVDLHLETMDAMSGSYYASMEKSLVFLGTREVCRLQQSCSSLYSLICPASGRRWLPCLDRVPNSRPWPFSSDLRGFYGSVELQGIRSVSLPAAALEELLVGAAEGGVDLDQLEDLLLPLPCVKHGEVVKAVARCKQLRRLTIDVDPQSCAPDAPEVMDHCWRTLREDVTRADSLRLTEALLQRDEPLDCLCLRNVHDKWTAPLVKALLEGGCVKTIVFEDCCVPNLLALAVANVLHANRCRIDVCFVRCQTTSDADAMLSAAYEENTTDSVIHMLDCSDKAPEGWCPITGNTGMSALVSFALPIDQVASRHRFLRRLESDAQCELSVYNSFIHVEERGARSEATRRGGSAPARLCSDPGQDVWTGVDKTEASGKLDDTLMHMLARIEAEREALLGAPLRGGVSPCEATPEEIEEGFSRPFTMWADEEQDDLNSRRLGRYVSSRSHSPSPGSQ